MEHIINFYPVGNADCTLVKLDNGRTIIIDCCFREVTKDDKGNPTMFDVKEDLLKELNKTNGHPYVDLYINTHPHEDHMVGFSDHFYCGDPADYDDKKDADKIIIGEMWVTPKLFTHKIADAVTCLRKEAKRRRALYDNDAEYKGEEGNYLHIIGYDKDKEFDSRYGYVPGKLVKKVNGHNFEWLEIFVHAPFKEEVTDSKEKDDKNLTSIVSQFRFKVEGKEDVVCKAIFGGDAEHPVWAHILENNQDEDKLKWNLLLAPHHCSWTFFGSDSKSNDVSESAIKILDDYQIGESAHIIASSDKIEDNDNNPPSYKAMKQYKKHLKNKDNFHCVADTNVENKISQPIVYKISTHGKTLQTKSASATESVTSRPAPRAGK